MFTAFKTKSNESIEPTKDFKTHIWSSFFFSSQKLFVDVEILCEEITSIDRVSTED